ncbi:MAG: Gfo/Idh/MocA family oxidoreductase [Ardenticatenales bacterium]|nr:Gfo/Idh/MocA family oxidoreductase [Ardenticatenales bacterium]
MLAEFAEHPDFTVSAVWDLNDAINKQIKSQYPAVRIASDADTLINDPDIDLVYIATPPVTHVTYGLQVIAAGKALLCEKPLAIDMDEGWELVEAAEAAGVATAINFIYGAGPLVDVITAQLDSGRLGELLNIEVRYQFPSWPLPNQLSAAAWITQRDQGGMVREMFSHFVYLLMRLFGDIEIISTVLQYPEGENAAESYVLSSLEVEGLPIWLMGGVGGPMAPRESELTIHGSRASLRIGGLRELTISAGDGWQPVLMPTGAPTPAQARLTELARRLAGEETLLPDLRDGLAVQEVIEEMLSDEE